MGEGTLRNSLSRRDALKATLLLAPFAMRVKAKAASRGELEKKRPCDGACCPESALVRIEGKECWPSSRRAAGLPAFTSDCKYHRHDVNFDNASGCELMMNPRLLDELTEEQLRRFIEACVGYPIPYAPTAGFGNCCWGEEGEAGCVI